MSSYKHFYDYLSKYEIATVCCYHVKYESQSESTLYSLPECQGNPCAISEVKKHQRDSNLQPLSS